MVVIRCYKFHCVALPIYTHGRTGLEQKRNKDEFVGIRDWQASESEQQATDSPHPNLIMSRNAHMDASGSMNEHLQMEQDSYVLFTAPIMFKYEYTCKLEGNLATEDDVHRLTTLFCQGCESKECKPSKEATQQESKGTSPSGGGNEAVSRAMTEAESKAADDRNEARLTASPKTGTGGVQRTSCLP
jgi:hypothetical protein